jgi:D-alanyl-lipoteichoic acid acyltransferase DltB (MBOAT superfamily)
MVQGPISKYGELAPELFKEHPFQWKNIKYGVQLMLWGFFKKMLVADRIGVYVNDIFYGNETPYGLTVLLGLICYGIQLYCDFSGGIDVIRGVSELFGIGMKDNFYQPYFSHSLGEFWRRWHISLGQWVKDYMFYPVSMSGWMGSLKKFLKKIVSRKMSNRIAMALSNIVVFAFVGVWHGLGTNFLGWGLYNGVILAISVILTDVYAAWKKKLKIDDTSKGWHIFTLARTLVIVTIGWVFDCASTASGAGALFLHMFWLGKSDFSMLSIGTLDTLVLGFGTISLLMVDILHEKGKSVREMLEEKNYWIQLVFWTAVIQLIACFGRIASAGGFMYANF